MDGTDFLMFLLFVWLAITGFKKMFVSFDNDGAIKQGLISWLLRWLK